MPQLSIAIVEDETVLREELIFQLSHLGFVAEGFADANQLYRRLAVARFSAVILDIGLSGEDGLSICRYLREHDKKIGIVFATARAMRGDRITGLHAGADAYLTKPIDIDELALILARFADRSEFSVSASAPASVEASCWELEKGGDHLIAPGGALVRLAVNEARLLRVLLDKPGEVAVNLDLATALGLLPDEFDKHRVEVIVSRLRDKVLRETGRKLPILTKRGLGYLFKI
jgi:two-component system, OmpR family, response regulator PhoP